jgi:hypothetical protein
MVYKQIKNNVEMIYIYFIIQQLINFIENSEVSYLID